MPSKATIIHDFKELQDSICASLEAADGGTPFREDLWERPEGGGGRTRVIEGRHIEKGGVNFSAVHGPMPGKIREALGVNAVDFLATGVSIVLHPRNPMVPIIHMNVRYFEMSDGTWWFGGGIDLTPHYIDPQDAQYFHQELKRVCDGHHPDYYPRFKQWADDYFFLKHRSETRGIGGIFFDRLSAEGRFTKEMRYAFVRDVGAAFAPLYLHFLEKHKAMPFRPTHTRWQRLRRGRYVEFNLVWDKGTRFGLDTDGRTASILMSLPPMASWEYNLQPAPGTAEAQTQALLKKGIDWVNYKGS